MHRCRSLLAAILLAATMLTTLGLSTLAVRGPGGSPRLDPPHGVTFAADGPRHTTAEPSAPVVVTLYHNTLEWHTRPHHFATAFVTHTEGIGSDGRGGETGRTGRANGRANGQGAVVLRLDNGTGGWQVFRPFDTMTLVTASFTGSLGTPYHVDVPELRVDVAADGTAVVGRAAPGTTVALALDAPPAGAAAVDQAVVVADAAGSFAWTLPAGAYLAPGQGGWATVLDADGNRFRARFVALSLRLMVGQAAASGWLTPADALEVWYHIRHEDGRVLPRRLSLSGQALDGRRSNTGAAASALTAGMPFTVTVDSPVLGARAILGAPLPDLTVDTLDAAAASGLAPAGAAVTVELHAPDAAEDQPPSVRLPTTAGPDGRWRVDFPPDTPLLAGGRAVVVLPVGDGVAAAATAVRPRITVAVDGARVGVQLAAYARFRVSTYAPDGTLIGRTSELGAGADGRVTLDLPTDHGFWEAGPRLPEGVLATLPRGGAVEVDMGDGGDPLRLIIPQLVATSDVTADTISGTAPPGAQVEVEVLAVTDTLRLGAAPDVNGRWSLSLAGQVDVAPGVGARAWFDDPAGHRYYVDTAPVTIVASPDSYYLSAAPWTGRPLRAEARDRAGRLVGSILRPADEGPDEDDRRLALTSTVGAWLVNAFGQEPAMAAGDTLWVQIGDDEATWVLPPLQGRIHPDLDLVVGATDPGAEVEVIGGEVDDPLAVVTTVTADAHGIFRADLAGRLDIHFGEGVYARRHDGPHTLLRYVRAPGLDVAIDRATVAGVLEPDVAIDVRLEAGGQVRAAGPAQASASGRFNALLRDEAGLAAVPRAGEQIIVESAEAQLYGYMALTVPPFGMAMAGDGRTIGGPRPEAAYFSVDASRAHYGWPLAGSAATVPFEETVAEPGRWEGRLGRPAQPGDRIRASLFLPSGHGLSREWVEPILAVEHGGPHVCGLTQPHAAVSLKLEAAGGAERATLHGMADAQGRVDLAWSNEAGGALRTGAGDRIRGRVGDADIDIYLDVMTATLDLAAGFLSGQVRPGAGPILTSPARDCLYRLTVADERWLAATGLRPTYESYGIGGPPADGRIRLRLPPAAFRDRGIDLHYDSAGGHRVYRTIYRPLVLAADVATGRVSGQAVPGASVWLALLGPDRQPRSTAAAAADAGGRFTAHFEDAAGATLSLATGDRIAALARGGPEASVADGGEQSAEMVIEALDVDPSKAAIIGHAPAGRVVGLLLAIPGVGSRWIERTAGPDGRFDLRAEDVPPRSGWTLADVSGGRVELEGEDGHRTVVSWPDGNAHAGRDLPAVGGAGEVGARTLRLSRHCRRTMRSARTTGAPGREAQRSRRRPPEWVVLSLSWRCRRRAHEPRRAQCGEVLDKRPYLGGNPLQALPPAHVHHRVPPHPPALDRRSRVHGLRPHRLPAPTAPAPTGDRAILPWSLRADLPLRGSEPGPPHPAHCRRWAGTPSADRGPAGPGLEVGRLGDDLVPIGRLEHRPDGDHLVPGPCGPRRYVAGAEAEGALSVGLARDGDHLTVLEPQQDLHLPIGGRLAHQRHAAAWRPVEAEALDGHRGCLGQRLHHHHVAGDDGHGIATAVHQVAVETAVLVGLHLHPSPLAAVGTAQDQREGLQRVRPTRHPVQAHVNLGQRAVHVAEDAVLRGGVQGQLHAGTGGQQGRRHEGLEGAVGAGALLEAEGDGDAHAKPRCLAGAGHCRLEEEGRVGRARALDEPVLPVHLEVEGR